MFSMVYPISKQTTGKIKEKRIAGKALERRIVGSGKTGCNLQPKMHPNIQPFQNE